VDWIDEGGEKVQGIGMGRVEDMMLLKLRGRHMKNTERQSLSTEL
jgi:hypothetical protein